MKKIILIYKILDRWKYSYLLSAFLLILSIFIRMLEPKILQIVVDNVIYFFTSGGQAASSAGDWVVNVFYLIVPEMKLDNLPYILLILCGLYMVIALLRGASMFIASTVSASSTEKAIKALRDKLFSHIQALPLSTHQQLSKGELIQRSTGDVDTVRRFLLNQVVEVIRLSAIFFFAFYMMLLVHIPYALISVALVPLIVVTAYLFFKREGKVWAEHEQEQDKLSTIVEENLSGMRVVKAFAAENHEIEKFGRQNLVKRNVGVKHVKLHAFFWPASDFMVHTQVAISVFAGGYFALNGQISVGELVSFFTYAVMVTWPLRQVGRIVSQTGMATVAAERIETILERETENLDGFTSEESLKGEIEFKNVSFSYEKDSELPVIKNLHLKISAGEKVAFMGPTGAGKTTVISLLNRFYEPDEGEIYLDGRPLNSYSKEWLRKRIGVVLQKAFLFSSSIKSNIAYTRPEAPDNIVAEMAEAAALHELMDIFSDGYETVVGEKGVTLSGGQQQRVALARTLLNNPDILVLDDTTSAVDTETEAHIQKALGQKMKHKTTIIIAHRINSIQHADRIIIFDKGKVIEDGTHEELLQKNGYYARVFSIQEAVEDDINLQL